MQVYVGQSLSGVLQSRRKERSPELVILLPTQAQLARRFLSELSKSLGAETRQGFRDLGRHPEEQTRDAGVPFDRVPSKNQEFVQKGFGEVPRPSTSGRGGDPAVKHRVRDRAPPGTVREAHIQDDKRKLRCTLNAQRIELRPKGSTLGNHWDIARSQSLGETSQCREAPLIEFMHQGERVASPPSGRQRRSIGGFSCCWRFRHIRLRKKRRALSMSFSRNGRTGTPSSGERGQALGAAAHNAH